MNDFTNHYSTDDDVKLNDDLDEIVQVGQESNYSKYCTCELPDCDSSLYWVAEGRKPVEGSYMLCMSGHPQKRYLK